VVLRRLNRVEYENTVRDLVGVAVDLQDLLPADTAAHGFDNIGEALHVSSFLMERYLEAADLVLKAAIANGPRPKNVKKRYRLKDQHQVKTTTERVFRLRKDAVVLFSSSPWQAVHLYQFYPPDRGRYRFRICASGFQSSGKPVTYRVDAGPFGMAGKPHLVGYFDAPADKPAVVEFVEQLQPRNTIRILPYGLANAQAVDKVGAANYKGAGLAVQWVEVEGPLHDSWPPASHRRLFGDLPRASVPGNRHRLEVVSKDPAADARRILGNFARRAFRRTVTDDELRSGLGARDRDKIDEYFTSVRELEQRLARAKEWSKKPKPRVKVKPPQNISNPADIIGRTRLMFDLIHLALQTDSTRLITMLLAGTSLVPTVPGVTLGHHDLSHHGQDPGKIGQLKKIEVATMETLRDLLARLKQTKEEGVSLLDRTMVFFGSNLGAGSTHSTRNLPVLLAGGGFKHGQYLAFDPGRPPPLSNLYVTMLQRLGVKVDRFGSGKGTLTGLETAG
jgi:hypothetical protein